MNPKCVYNFGASNGSCVFLEPSSSDRSPLTTGQADLSDALACLPAETRRASVSVHRPPPPCPQTGDRAWDRRDRKSSLGLQPLPPQGIRRLDCTDEPRPAEEVVRGNRFVFSAKQSNQLKPLYENGTWLISQSVFNALRLDCSLKQLRKDDNILAPRFWTE